MKNFVIRLFCLVAFSVGAVAPAHAVTAGVMAPEIDLPGAPAPFKLSAQRGKLVYVDFWASWCAPCRLSFPFLNEMQAKYGAQGFVVVGINVDAKRADADKFLAQVPARFAIAFDPKGDSPSRYAAKAMPTSYLVAPDGKVLVVHNGFREEDKKDIEDKIRAALPKR